MSSSWSWWNVLLFSGRINRLRFLIVMAACFFYLTLVGGDDLAKGSYDQALILTLPVLYLNLTTGIQRLHDMGYTGWLVLLYLIPGANFIIMIISLCLKGNSGANQYGPDPLS